MVLASQGSNHRSDMTACNISEVGSIIELCLVVFWGVAYVRSTSFQQLLWCVGEGGSGNQNVFAEKRDNSFRTEIGLFPIYSRGRNIHAV